MVLELIVVVIGSDYKLNIKIEMKFSLFFKRFCEGFFSCSLKVLKISFK